MSWYRWQGGDLVLEVRVQPRCRRNEVQGPQGGALRLRLTAPPVDDKANEALCRWLADDFGVTRAAVELLRGATARAKVLKVGRPRAAPAWFTVHGGEWPAPG